MDWIIPHGDIGRGHHIYLDEEFDCSVGNTKTKGRRRKKLLYQTVRETMEFYFSDANISKDRYLRELVERDPYVSLEEFLKFNKVKSLVGTVEDIAKAVKKSEILELSEDLLRVRRVTPIKIRENEDECTIYVENLPPGISHDELSKIFSKFGKVVYVSIPKFSNTKQPKGFAFVEFETPEDAAETIRIFMEKGSCLSPHMLPEKLCSIQTYENPNTSASHKSIMRKGVESKSEPFAKKSHTNNVMDSQVIETNGAVAEGDCDVHFTKVELKGDSAKMAQDENVVIESFSNKRSLVMEDSLDESISKSKKMKVESESEKEKEATSEPEISHDSQNDDSTAKAKKKNRKKRKRPKEDDVFAHGVVILSKKEWKRLRSKYLNMQRVNMRRVKQQVLEARFMRRPPYLPPVTLDHGRDEEMPPPPPPVDAPKPRVSYTPGVIVCVKFKEPMVDIKGFKAEARTQPGVQYVDIREGALEAYLRCSGPVEAQHLLKVRFWTNMFILSGNDESNYWDKIFKDREEKLGKKLRVTKERGKKKLLRKAEIVKATHLHFDN